MRRDGGGIDAGDTLDSGETGVCGDRIIQVGEDCDDGNLVAGDGCEPVTCQYSCTGDVGCDDGDNCTIDACDSGSHMCSFSGPPSCVAPSPCRTFAGCDESGLCLYDLIDADRDGYASSLLGTCGSDCNDSDGSVHPGQPEVCDGADQNCDGNADEGVGTPCGRDADRDGFGSRSMVVYSCDAICPVGHVADVTDCWDAPGAFTPPSSYANPAATVYSPLPRGDGTGSYDWNCDGSEEPLYMHSFRACDLEFGGCASQSGWTSAVPACGVSAEYTFCAMGPGSTSCVTSTDTVRQACR